MALETWMLPLVLVVLGSANGGGSYCCQSSATDVPRYQGLVDVGFPTQKSLTIARTKVLSLDVLQ
eukprot:82726-Amphidinium_carterae.1